MRKSKAASLLGFLCLLLFGIVSGHCRSLDFQLRITNRYFGAIEVSSDGGRTWKKQGRVLKPLNGRYKTIQPKEFTASDWAPVGTVAATAVNAIHVKIGQPGPHAAVFSILPKELLPGMDRPASYFDELSTLYTDNCAGTGIFAEQSPLVGSPFFLVDRVTGKRSKPAPLYAPKVGDTIVFTVSFEHPPFDHITFENRFDGKVIGRREGEKTVLGRVLRPVCGTGRFGGSKYLGAGLLRANHPGVICLSTGPVGELGGFQIVPAVHGSDLDIPYIRTVPAWMVVGPVSFGDGALEGQWPLYKGLFRPGQWEVLFRWTGSEVFEPMEPIVGKKLSSMLGVAEIMLRPVQYPRPY